MVIDIVEERGLADIDIKWGDPWDCHFPLIHGIKAPSLPWMIMIYTVMWTGAFGIALGLHFKIACACFVLPYWYIFLLDKGYWNNHTYLYGIVATLFWGTEANKYFALDASNARRNGNSVPYWNYFILKFQFFALYFLAGLKKSGREWLEGYAMTNLSRHWVFHPFNVKETDSQIKKSLSSDCSALPSNEILHNETTHKESNIKVDQKDNDTQSKSKNSIESDEKEAASICKKFRGGQQPPKATRKQKFVVSLLLCHVMLQFFLPYSHFISKGYNNWVPGLYGYSWDMMIHAWDTILVVIKVHDNANNKVRYLDPEAWVQGDRWVRHGDMAIQYSQCLKDNLMRRREETLSTRHRLEDKEKWTNKKSPQISGLSTNLSIYMDVWCSLNGRFQQRIFDPNVDMLTVDWHPLKPVSFLMPLLTRYNSYRYKLEEIQQHVYTWSNYTDVLFVADFPGMYLENYISTDFANVSLTVLEGEVTYNEEDSASTITIPKERSIPVKTGMFHRVKTTSSYPACYMYTYTNQTKEQLDSDR
ncbi:vitamin k-dependent gamma-carboxylase [Lasius niger]|uniref:Vitamin k-dependent gamma-carboxylase n=1 Tax=Lasius niger TaxID=67767 RepID=A0A0J7KTF8_LASNI|nr:vitamin k-dependent gamma-carboxylase [Lasius niger]